MSTPQSSLQPAEEGSPSPTATTTVVRAEPGLAQQREDDLHPQARAILREATLRSGAALPEQALLLKLASVQFEAMDAERRGIVQSMRLMADEAAELAYRARESELTERVAVAERAVLEQLTGSAPLAQILASITRFIESVGVGTVCSIAVLTAERESFAYVVAPRMPAKLRMALERCAVEIRNGSCAAAVYLGRQVLVADIGTDPFWEQPRAQALQAGLNAAWSTPIKAADGRVLGALCVY
ncbi:MAG: GAF domain-containing protein, partial [Solirubrobacteraceae bacterium]